MFNFRKKTEATRRTISAQPTPTRSGVMSNRRESEDRYSGGYGSHQAVDYSYSDSGSSYSSSDSCYDSGSSYSSSDSCSSGSD